MSNNIEQKDEVTAFAETNFRGEPKRFGIKTDDRRRHMYLVGKTGMGKSVTLENMIYSDIQAGHSVCVVDPHGDLAEKVLDFVPSNRVNDVIYFNPADIDYPIAFNILEKVDPHYRHLVASGLIGVFKKIWADSWGPRLEYVLRNAILALLDYPDSTLLGINRMFVDKDYRKKVITKIQDPVVKTFWAEEFAKYGPQFAVEAVAPIQNKVGQFLSTSLIRNVVGQVKSTIDVRDVMDSRKILILNLAKGRIGEDSSGLMGAMMITKIQLAAMSRVDIPEPERRDFYLYVDEFQNFATESFANILSEARKYHLNLILAHQYIEQLNEVVKPAVFGNVGTMIVFRVGAADAEELVKEFTPRFTEEDLVNLPKYNVYMKLMIDGISSDPFSAITLPPIYKNLGNREKIITVSRERYAKPRDVVEDKIRRWSGVGGYEEEEDEPSSAPPGGATEGREKKPQVYGEVYKEVPKKERKGINFLQPIHEEPSPAEVVEEKSSFAPSFAEATEDRKASEDRRKKKPAPVSMEDRFEESCWNCKRTVFTPFKPDGKRPVYCKDCLKKARRGLLTPAAKEKAEPLRVSPSLANTVKVEPIDRGGKESISLTEALRQPPVTFRKAENKTSEIKPPPLPSSFAPSSAEAMKGRKATDDRPRPAFNGKTVKPGEVIKFE